MPRSYWSVKKYGSSGSGPVLVEHRRGHDRRLVEGVGPVLDPHARCPRNGCSTLAMSPTAKMSGSLVRPCGVGRDAVVDGQARRLRELDVGRRPDAHDHGVRGHDRAVAEPDAR